MSLVIKSTDYVSTEPALIGLLKKYKVWTFYDMYTYPFINPLLNAGIVELMVAVL